MKLLALRAFAEVDPKSGAAESTSLLCWGERRPSRTAARRSSIQSERPKDRLVGEAINQALLKGLSSSPRPGTLARTAIRSIRRRRMGSLR